MAKHNWAHVAIIIAAHRGVSADRISRCILRFDPQRCTHKIANGYVITSYLPLFCLSTLLATYAFYKKHKTTRCSSPTGISFALV